MAREEKSVYPLPTLEEVGGYENHGVTQSSTDSTATNEGVARTLLSNFLAV